MRPVPLHADVESIAREQASRFVGQVLAARLHIAPFVVILAIGLCVFDPSPWRRVVIAGTAAAMVGLSLVEVARYRRTGVAPATVPANIGAGAFLQVLLVFATGGIESPAAPAIPMLSLLAAVVLGRCRALTAVLVFQGVGLWVMTAIAVLGRVPDLTLSFFGGGPRAGHSDALLVTAAAGYTAVVGVATTLGTALHGAVALTIGRVKEAQDETLRLHAVQARELQALSGEIAHELKNPLASVKGLAALLARDLADGKSAERLAVLRREVDRMQGILDEFLNFSRPLVPLSQERVDLGALCGEVAALHEGLARERRVALAVDVQGTARCDPRKVKQVLVNLVQNALDASPPGEVVEVRSAPGEPGLVRLHVEDRGPGLDGAVAGRVFDAGVTTKPLGSGLGLTVARSLARQHGGDLDLHPRPGGGCRARLTLPEGGLPDALARPA